MNRGRPKISESVRREVFARTGGACYYCGALATDLDHIVPRSYIADDTADNLVAACGICNAIAHNFHFKSLSEKKEYILEERSSEKWRRRLARMVVTLVTVDEYGEPVGIVAGAKPAYAKADVWEPKPEPPFKNPFKPRPGQPPAKKVPEVRQEAAGASKTASGRTPEPERVKDAPWQLETRRYIKSLVNGGIRLSSIRSCLFPRSGISTLRAVCKDEPISRYMFFKLYGQLEVNRSQAKWILGERAWHIK